VWEENPHLRFPVALKNFNGRDAPLSLCDCKPNTDAGYRVRPNHVYTTN